MTEKEEYVNVYQFKAPALFALQWIPFAVIGGIAVTFYQMEMFDKHVIDEAIDQVGGEWNFILLASLQSTCVSFIAAFFGYILAQKVGLMKSLSLRRKNLGKVIFFSVLMGCFMATDLLFVEVIPQLKRTQKKDTWYSWIAALFYGGVTEELIMRLLIMSFIVLILSKIAGNHSSVLVVSNIITAIGFAAGHLPATTIMLGELSPIIIFRCFLYNGLLGACFGRFYRKYGIQYAMISHALVHVVSKTLTFVIKHKS